MRRFAIPSPAPVLSLADAAAAFLTLTLAVVLPAQLAPYDGHPFMIAARDAIGVSAARALPEHVPTSSRAI